jgi:hypothetical protein
MLRERLLQTGSNYLATRGIEVKAFGRVSEGASACWWRPASAPDTNVCLEVAQAIGRMKAGLHEVSEWSKRLSDANALSRWLPVPLDVLRQAEEARTQVWASLIPGLRSLPRELDLVEGRVSGEDARRGLVEIRALVDRTIPGLNGVTRSSPAWTATLQDITAIRLKLEALRRVLHR